MRYELIAPRDYNLSAVDQVLVNRGIKPENINRFKHPTLDDNFNPLLLEHVKVGAQMLIKHIEQNDKVFCQVD